MNQVTTLLNTYVSPKKLRLPQINLYLLIYHSTKIYSFIKSFFAYFTFNPRIYFVQKKQKQKSTTLFEITQADVNFVTALVPSETACFANSPGNANLTAVQISREVIVVFLLQRANFDASPAIRSKISFINEFIILIALLLIPISGWTYFKTLQMYILNVSSLDFFRIFFSGFATLTAFLAGVVFSALGAIIIYINQQFRRKQYVSNNKQKNGSTDRTPYFVRRTDDRGLLINFISTMKLIPHCLTG
eukprot:TRINITY_DN3227_c1_g1_i1.p1 TRINITY_DN3227_c1_g1~~TRINITY_DN3227_c1_g1_i1.p1  ORF type:complete len:284 (+),score=14.68 TRINITY_DN3227_c1_g1_i1:112-852(+)